MKKIYIQLIVIIVYFVCLPIYVNLLIGNFMTFKMPWKLFFFQSIATKKYSSFWQLWKKSIFGACCNHPWNVYINHVTVPSLVLYGKNLIFNFRIQPELHLFHYKQEACPFSLSVHRKKLHAHTLVSTYKEFRFIYPFADLIKFDQSVHLLCSSLEDHSSSAEPVFSMTFFIQRRIRNKCV